MTPLARNIRNELIHNSAWLRGLNWGHRADLERRDRELTILHRELRVKDREIRDLRRIVLTGRAA